MQTEKIKLYYGIKKEGIRYNYAFVDKIVGAGLAVLDGVDSSGPARLLSLLKKSVTKLGSEDGKELVLNDFDYFSFYGQDCWKMARMAMKRILNKSKLIFPEYFYCDVCSTIGHENYTKHEEDWDDLIAQGIVYETYIEDDEEPYYWTELPVGINIVPTQTIKGGTFNKLKREPITLGKMIKLNKNKWASETEANMIYSTWDVSIAEIDGMSQRDFDILVTRNPHNSFTKQYIIHQEDQDQMEIDSTTKKIMGMDFSGRQVTCRHCGNEIGGYPDFTNFFQSLLPKRSIRGHIQR